VSLRNLSGEVEVYEIFLGSKPEETLIDPVCRMRVDRHSAAGRLRYESKEYWFCSLQCASEFAAHPDRYVVPAG
jgi:adenylate cyclase